MGEWTLEWKILTLTSPLAVLIGSAVACSILEAIGFAVGPLVIDLSMAKESVAGRTAGWIHGVWLGFGILAPAMGGYLAARIARVQPLLHATLVGICGSIAFVISSQNIRLMVVYALSLFLPSAIFGGLYRKREQRSGGVR
jgi:hypothetical protein